MSRNRRQKTSGQPSPKHVQEIIGRVAFSDPGLYVAGAVSIDQTRPDAAFWDAVRYGTRSDYALGGLFAEPIATTISAWVLGKGVTFEVDGSDSTTAALNMMVDQNMQQLIDTYEDSLALGNGFTLVGTDGSLTRIPPDQLSIETDPPGSLKVASFTIKTRLTSMGIDDQYTAEERTITTEEAGGGGGRKTTEKYPNQIGIIPIIHWPMKRAANELWGRPYFSRLLPLFGRYNKVLMKALDATELMGNPIPTVEGVENPQETLGMLAGNNKETITDPVTGVVTTRYKVDFSKLPLIVLGKGGSFKFSAPNTGFTTDSGRVLEYLFLLMLQYSQIPEWVWGGAIASSKASVDAQLPAFVNLIDGLRRKLEVILRQIAKVYLTTIALYTPGIDPDAQITVKWPKSAADDRTVVLEYIKYAADKGWLTDETGLRLTGLVENPEGEVRDARAEQAEFGDPYNQAVDNFIKTDAVNGAP